jgi:hypothetical protein
MLDNSVITRAAEHAGLAGNALLCNTAVLWRRFEGFAIRQLCPASLRVSRRAAALPQALEAALAQLPPGISNPGIPQLYAVLRYHFCPASSTGLKGLLVSSSDLI